MAPPAEVDLLAVRNGSVVAPAGFGKTHQIVTTLSAYTGGRRILVLTHTNAGVAEVRARLNAAHVDTKRYRLQTIDGWARRLSSAFPGRSGIRREALELSNPKADYIEIRAAAAALLAAGHITDALAATYSHVIVDEYQDCTQKQHEIIRHLSTVVPVCALGDPLQAIFGFGRDPLADWNGDVLNVFPLSHELMVPWRWRNAGTEALGEWLTDVRATLVAAGRIDLRVAPPAFVRCHLLHGTPSDRGVKHLAAASLPPNKGGTVFVLADSRRSDEQQAMARSVPGASTVEPVELTDLVRFADAVGQPNADVLALTIAFAADVMTGVQQTALHNRLGILSRGTSRSAASPAEGALLKLKAQPIAQRIADALVALRGQTGARSHRPALYFGCLDALRIHAAADGLTLGEAARRVREKRRAEVRVTASRAVGSTLLLKGLQADLVVVLNASAMETKHLYVAMTRGVRSLVLCSESSVLTPR